MKRKVNRYIFSKTYARNNHTDQPNSSHSIVLPIQSNRQGYWHNDLSTVNIDSYKLADANKFHCRNAVTAIDAGAVRVVD